MTVGSPRKRLLVALAFLLPNLLGFLVFTLGPVVYSLAMSFTDWALTKHNRYSSDHVRWVGIENYQRILAGDESRLFWDYLGNTLFLMLGIPIGIAGSLGLALMLHSKFAPERAGSRVKGASIAVLLGLIACAGVWVATSPGPAPPGGSGAMSTEAGLTDLSLWQVESLRSGAAVLATAVLGALVVLGLAVGPSFFRTVFYLPSLLSGVAMFLLWKTLYKPRGGLINAGLEPVLGLVQRAATGLPAWCWYGCGVAAWLTTGLLAIRLFWRGVSKLAHGESGLAAFAGRIGVIAVLLVCGFGFGRALVQLPPVSLLESGRTVLDGAGLDGVVAGVIRARGAAVEADVRAAAAGLGAGARTEDVIGALSSAAGGGAEAERLVRREVFARTRAEHAGWSGGAGLRAPEWLVDARWAKTALIVMGVWCGLGGSTMLLYLAGLGNVPPELYEAASIDGASGWRKFIHVTWPQLAPTTFFIVVMSLIGGLQGGFEQAMVMTQGKADTIVLAYYIYNVAFTDQFQLGLASAIAWVMFAMIFVMTVLNFRLGSRLTND